MKERIILFSTAAAVALGAGQPAFCQEATAPDASESSQEAAPGLENIVVTAQRRSERLQDVPIAINATSAQRLESIGIRNAQDLSVVTPALTSSNAFGSFQPRLRGVGSSVNGPGTENSVAVYVDDVYISAQTGSIFSFNNVERIEVLKGPQGTLFGRNATGGLIHVITKSPSSTFGGKLEAGYGNYDTYSFSGYVTAPLGENVAADFAAVGRFQGRGYGVNFADGRDTNRTNRDFGFRSKVLINPTDRTEIRLIGDYSEIRGSYGALRAGDDTLPAFGPPPPGGPYDINNDTPSLNGFAGGGGSLRIDQELGDIKLVSITAYRRSYSDTLFDFDLTPTPGLSVGFRQFDSQFSQELQVQSGVTSPVRWVVGGFYLKSKNGYRYNDFSVLSALQVPGSPFFPRRRISNTSNQVSESYAAFGQVTVDLGNDTRLTGGLRYTHETRDLEAAQTLFLVTTPNGINLIPPGQETKSTGFSKVTWRASLDHKVTPDVMVYASANRGFKSGGYNLGTPTAAPYKPEILDAYELGAKIDLAGRTLRVNPSIYYYEYSNLQVPIILNTGVQGVVNGPRSKIYGIDIDVEWRASSALTITGGITALHDRFQSFPNAVINEPKGVGNFQVLGDATGNRLPYTSDLTSSLGATYGIDVSDGSKIELTGNWNHNDGYFTAADNIRRQKAYDLFNASIGWTSTSGQVTAKIWGRNLSNEPVLLFNNAATQVTAVAYNPPRTYGISLGVNF